MMYLPSCPNEVWIHSVRCWARFKAQQLGCAPFVVAEPGLCRKFLRDKTMRFWWVTARTMRLRLNHMPLDDMALR